MKYYCQRVAIIFMFAMSGISSFIFGGTISGNSDKMCGLDAAYVAMNILDKEKNLNDINQFLNADKSYQDLEAINELLRLNGIYTLAVKDVNKLNCLSSLVGIGFMSGQNDVGHFFVFKKNGKKAAIFIPPDKNQVVAFDQIITKKFRGESLLLFDNYASYLLVLLVTIIRNISVNWYILLMFSLVCTCSLLLKRKYIRLSVTLFLVLILLVLIMYKGVVFISGLEPKLEVMLKNATLDLGSSGPGQVKEFSFSIKNIGKRKVVVQHIKPSCSCIENLKIDDNVILPGQESLIFGKYKYPAIGKAVNDFTIITNESEPLHKIKVIGRSNTLISFEKLQLYFTGDKKTKSFYIYCLRDSENEYPVIEKVISNEKYISVSLKKLTESMLSGVEIYRVDVELLESTPKGKQIAYLNIYTDAPDQLSEMKLKIFIDH